MGERKRKICMTSIARLLITIACRFHSIAHSRTPLCPLRRLSANFSIGKLEGGSNLTRCAFFLLCKSFDLLHFKSATGAAKKDRLCTLCESRLYGSYPCIVKFSRPISKTAKPKQYFQAQYEHKQARIKHHGAAVTTKWRRIEAYGQRIICVMTRTR